MYLISSNLMQAYFSSHMHKHSACHYRKFHTERQSNINYSPESLQIGNLFPLEILKLYHRFVIAVYFMGIMVMTSISVIATITALNCHHRSTDTHTMSKFVSIYFCISSYSLASTGSPLVNIPLMIAWRQTLIELQEQATTIKDTHISTVSDFLSSLMGTSLLPEQGWGVLNGEKW